MVYLFFVITALLLLIKMAMYIGILDFITGLFTLIPRSCPTCSWLTVSKKRAFCDSSRLQSLALVG
jgi:hypothetical protein